MKLAPLSLTILSLAAAVCLSSAQTASTPEYAVLQKFPIEGDGGWDYLTVDSGSHRLFISRGTHVQVMDTETGKLVGDIAGTNGVHGIAIATKAGKGFTSNGRDNTVTVFDLKTYKEIAKVKVGTGPDAIIYDRGSNRVFTFNGRSSDATAIDASTIAVVGTVALDGRPEFPAPDGKGNIFVNIEDKSEVQQIDSKNLTAVKKWSLAPGDGPSGMVIDPKNHRTFSVCGNGMMVISDTEAGKVLTTQKIGDGCDAAGFDSGMNVAFSSNGDGTLTIVKCAAGGVFSVLQNVATQKSARTMALDRKTHKVYLIAADFSAPAAGERRGKMTPGSTVILVVGPKS